MQRGALEMSHALSAVIVMMTADVAAAALFHHLTPRSRG